MKSSSQEPTYTRVHAVVQQIPPGRVSTYGQIASIVGRCTARMVGYALASLPQGSDVPWQRVINAQGKISPRAHSADTALQRELLEQEGIEFGPSGRVDFTKVRWQGPSVDWLLEHGYDPGPSWTER